MTKLALINFVWIFGPSGETVSRYFNLVLNVVLRMQETLLKAQDPIPEDCLDERWKWFKGCLGVLDGTHIIVNVPAIDKPRYRNRKGDISTNVLGAYSRDMKFIYVLPGWERSASDSRVLRDAISRRNGYYYFVDAGYANCEGFLPPYRGYRYHRSEWRQGREMPTDPIEAQLDAIWETQFHNADVALGD
ncbi:uncharacterized protein LOC120255339, partial [Dioscorea cayenensis subsp. rotundata]|uniref:Uncharacterized protein LOC120255339 n=1 Tax=Dioscorea cayennensis subsp. rotundata TaxID=55577 RepID=A0AB40AWK4_DIOCR